MSMKKIEIPYSLWSTVREALTVYQNQLYCEHQNFSEANISKKIKESVNPTEIERLIEKARRHDSHLDAVNIFLDLTEKEK